MNDADRAAIRARLDVFRNWAYGVPDIRARNHTALKRQVATDLAALLDENERLREALERVIGMCDVPERCRCGRPTGLGAVVLCARNALAEREGV